MADLTLKQLLDLGPTNQLAELLSSRKLALGTLLDALATALAGTLTEETVTVTTNVGVLSAKAVAVFGAWASAGSTTGLITLVPPSVTVITKTAKLATDRRTLTFFGTDAVTEAKVLYLPAPTAVSGLAAALAAVAGP